MKKKIISIVIIISIIIILEIIIVLLMKWKNTKAELFISSYDYPKMVSYGYKIYVDGTIREYDINKSKEELKVAKIKNYELTQLKNLTNLVETNYIKGLNPISKFYPNTPYGRIVAVDDAGIEEKRIYKSVDKK